MITQVIGIKQGLNLNWSTFGLFLVLILKVAGKLRASWSQIYLLDQREYKSSLLVVYY